MSNNTQTAKKTYLEKLKDPRWQIKRLEILSRDNFACRRCGDDEKTLYVHHINYIKGNTPWEYNNNRLITLCDDCHGEEHDAKDFAFWVGHIINNIRQRGILNSDIIDMLEEASDHCLSRGDFRAFFGCFVEKGVEDYLKKELQGEDLPKNE